jgi:hypothetical protein
MDKPVIYIMCLQNHVDDEIRRIDNNIISYPLSWFIPISREIISLPLLVMKKKVMLFQV